jgi:hypothetical protein
MKCQNKQKQLPEQVCMPKQKNNIKINQNKGQNKLILWWYMLLL